MCRSMHLCMSAMPHCLHLPSNFLKGKQSVKAWRTCLIFVPLPACRVPHWASPVGWIYIQIYRTTRFVAGTPVCLHEELERMCSCQLSASASRQKEGSVVSLLILELWIGSWHYPVWLWWTKSSHCSSFTFQGNYYYRACAWLVLTTKMKVNQQAFL